MPVKEYVWNGTDWGTDVPDDGTQTPQEERAALVAGTYIPGPEYTPNSVGIFGESSIVNVISGGADGGVYNSFTTNQVINNTRFERAVQIPSGRGTITFNNCHFVGNNPQLIQSKRESGVNPAYYSNGITNWSSTKIILNDCTIDHGWWRDKGLSNRYSTQWSPAVAGGFAILNRCHVLRFTDNFNFAGRPSGEDQQVLIHACRLGPNYYGTSSQSGGYTHSDGFQFNTGRNVEIRYSYIGGPRFASDRTLTTIGSITRDASNAGMMIQQEDDGDYDLTDTEAWLIDNVYIHDNWLAGGSATINLNYRMGNKLPAPGMYADRDGSRVVNNRFMIRQSGINESGYQMRFYSGMETDVSGNVTWVPGESIYGNGSPITIHEVINNNDGNGDQVVDTWPSPAAN